NYRKWFRNTLTSANKLIVLSLFHDGSNSRKRLHRRMLPEPVGDDVAHHHRAFAAIVPFTGAGFFQHGVKIATADDIINGGDAVSVLQIQWLAVDGDGRHHTIRLVDGLRARRSRAVMHRHARDMGFRSGGLPAALRQPVVE